MEEIRARAEFPTWASAPLHEQEVEILPFRMRVENKFHVLKKRFGIVVIATLGLMVWTVGTCMVTGSIVRRNTTAEVTSEMRANFTEYLAQMENERVASQLLTGEASKQTAIKKDAILLSRVGQGVLNTYHSAGIEDARKVMLCALCRVYSGGEFAGIGSIEEAVKQKDQWWGYADNLAYTEAVHSVAMEVSEIYHNAEPMPCSSDMVYAGWNGDQIVLRNRWEANASARYFS